MRPYRSEAEWLIRERDPYEGWTSLDEFLDERGYSRGGHRACDQARHSSCSSRKRWREKKLSKARMAEMMETSRAAAARILDPEEYNVTLDTLARAAKVLGRRLSIELS